MGATPGISTTDARQKGFEDEIKTAYPGITLLTTQFSQSTPATATSKMAAIIAAHRDVAGVFAVSTQEVEGVSVAVKSAGASGKIKIVGFDTSDPIVQDVKDGLVQGLVVQEPLEMGRQAMQQMVKAIRGATTTPVIHTPFVFLTKDNVDDPEVNKYIYKTSC
jgi:ribose transport system substrate-binding protein